MAYADHEQRAVDERTALVDKHDKLNHFMVTETFANLRLAERRLLKQQMDVMWEYAEILHARISLFKA